MATFYPREMVREILYVLKHLDKQNLDLERNNKILLLIFFQLESPLKTLLLDLFPHQKIASHLH